MTASWILIVLLTCMVLRSRLARTGPSNETDDVHYRGTEAVKQISRCRPDQYECWGGGTCIPAESFCDGVVDCEDVSDEVDFQLLWQSASGVLKQQFVPCQPMVRRNGSHGANVCALWKSWVCDGVYQQCLGDLDEVCWQPPSGDCGPILQHLRCNGYRDCPDGSDEEGCAEYRCTSLDSSHANGTITSGQFCNGKKDCANGVDECMEFCNNECHCSHMLYGLCEGGYVCPTKKSDCRSCGDGRTTYGISQLCDGVFDCPNGRDENCAWFTCRNKKRIRAALACDDVDDCGDNSDNCSEVAFCPNLKPILIEQLCDGHNDCGDHSDECQHEHCTSKDRFVCRSGECIARGAFCDGTIDCKDGTDEIMTDADDDLLPAAVLCRNTLNSFNKSCILRQESWMCDLADHCVDRSDECQSHCKSSFRCDGAKCLPIYAFCNGVPDCDDGTDEVKYIGGDGLFPCSNLFHHKGECALSTSHPWACDRLIHCSNGTDQCLPGCSSVFQCGSGECVAKDEVCDGKRDCQDGSDERAGDEETFTCVRTRHPITRTCLLPLSITYDDVADCDRNMDLLSLPQTDEENATVRTESTKVSNFRCIGEKRVIPGEKQCDGIFDCALLSDECMCDHSPHLCKRLCYGATSSQGGMEDPCSACNVGEIMCGKKCIRRQQVCDGTKDCTDGTDETSCARYEKCTNDNSNCEPDFTCKSDKRSKARLCDGRPECDHFEDECTESCANVTALPEFCRHLISEMAFAPGLSVYVCNSMGIILKSSDVCDGRFRDCPAGEDEKGCPQRIYCNSTKTGNDTTEGVIHITPSQVCNGKIDCENMEDEENCDDHFYCKEGKPFFVPMRMVTDGKDDCYDGSDECPDNRFSHDVFSSREQMIRDPVLSCLIWFMGGLSIIGNMAVFGETLYNLLWAKDKMKNKRPFAKTNHVLVINLALADFLMGVYLIILASKAAQTSGRYCREDKPWRSSATCDFLGTLAVLSCVNSVLILVILTSYRVYGVMWPYKCNDLNHMKAQWFALLAWTISFLLAVLPVMAPESLSFKSHIWIQHNPHFQRDIVDRRTLLDFVKKLPLFYNGTGVNQHPKDSWSHLKDAMTTTFGAGAIRGEFGYYSEHSVCLPKLYVHKGDIGWEHSVVIVVFNFVAFFYIVICYGYILYKTTNTKKRSSRQSSMMRRISYLVVSDLICWLPICVMAFLNLTGHDVGEKAYAISAVILLPINSALNPLLYSNVIQNTIVQLFTCGRKSVTSGLRRPSPLACAVSHPVGFAVNVALVMSQWQHREQTVPLHPATNAKHEAEQAASTISQVFGIARPGI